MQHNIIYIINNKLHNKKYKLYTFIFYALIMHTYYILYINLRTNNYISIFIYFALLLLFYIKFKKFSYIISYIYLLLTFFFNKLKVKENLNLRQHVQSTRSSTQSNLESNMPEPDNNMSPCEKYIIDRMVEDGLTVEQPANTPQPGSISTALNLTTQPPSISTQLVD